METQFLPNTYSVRKLRKTSVVASFDCGDDDLNDFISNESLDYQKARLSVTYIYESCSGHVDGYISLANDRISLSDFENKTEFNRSDFPMPSASKVIQP